ncbi:MAG: ComF family protein [Lachnospiraceae bacterium]|nr:ComF family protein [Lachnospiraceae bacterium]
MDLKRIVKKADSKVLQYLYPLRCPACDRIVKPYGENICPECLGKFKLIAMPRCTVCGKKLWEEKDVCDDCAVRERKFEKGISLYEYDSVADAIYRFKYEGRAEYGEYFGKELARLCGPFIKSLKPDMLIPVPLSREKLGKRGYNQAALLAEECGKKLGIPCEENMVIRENSTAPLKKLGFAGRQINLKNAFIMAQNGVKSKRVVVIDDIFTTGSTIEAMASVLYEAGAEAVYFVTLASGK